MISGSIGLQIGGQAKGLIADMSIRGAKFNKLDK